MNAITRRVRRLEQRVFPPDDEEMRQVVEVIRERWKRRLEAQGLPYREDDRPDEDLRGMSIIEIIQKARLERLQAQERAMGAP